MKKSLKKDFGLLGKWLTNKTKNNLDNLTKEISKAFSRESSKGWLIWKEINTLEKEIIERTDNINLFWEKWLSYRDAIETKIDFLWVRESLWKQESEEIAAFYNYFTIKYINLLDKKWIKKTKEHKRQTLDLSIEELDRILEKVLKRLIIDWIEQKHSKIVIQTKQWPIKIDIKKKKAKIRNKNIQEKIKLLRINIQLDKKTPL